MAKVTVRKNENGFVGILDSDSSNKLNEEQLEQLFKAMESATIDKITLDNNELRLLISGNYLVIENFDEFDESDKFISFKEKIKELVSDRNKEVVEEVQELSENKKKVSRFSSISGKTKTRIIALALAGIGTVTFVHYARKNKNIDVNDRLNVATQIADNNLPIDVTPEPIVSTPEPTKVPYTPEPIINPVDETKELKNKFIKEIDDYARANNVYTNEISYMLYNNEDYSEERLNHFKVLIDYISYFKKNTLTIEIINVNPELSCLFAHNYNKFVVIPSNFESINSIVQLNPGKTSSYYCYENILNDIKSGNIPNCILVGTANNEVDFDNYANGNLLEKIISFSIKKGVSIKNVGILGYNESGYTALVNAGRILEFYPDMNVRVANVDGYIGNFIKDMKNNNNNGKSKFGLAYGVEITTLLNSNAEILSIIPGKSGFGISDGRPREAMKECMELGKLFNNTNIIATKTNNSEEMLKEAYRMLVIKYLMGEITWQDLVDGTVYYIPEPIYETYNNYVAPSEPETDYQLPIAYINDSNPDFTFEEEAGIVIGESTDTVVDSGSTEEVTEPTLEQEDVVNDVIHFGM